MGKSPPKDDRWKNRRLSLERERKRLSRAKNKKQKAPSKAQVNEQNEQLKKENKKLRAILESPAVNLFTWVNSYNGAIAKNEAKLREIKLDRATEK